MSPLQLLPAVDVAAGRACQVVHGSDDPLTVASRWVSQGARWVHLVDLDRAHRRGEATALLAAVVAALPVPVQLSGGVDDEESLAAALGTGAARVNLASTALRDPEWVREAVAAHGERVVVGVDVRDRQVVARGSGVRIGDLDDVLATLAAISPPRLLVADAGRDGTRHGVDTDLFRFVAERTEAPVVASGGVASLADLRALRALADTGVEAVVLGSALYHGAFTLAEALEVAG